MIKSMNIAWWVQRWSELQPQKAAVICRGETISYRRLHLRANRSACWLQSVGVEKGDRVAVVLGNCPEFIDLYLACARLGAIFVPLNFRLTARGLTHMLENARPRLLLYDVAHAATVNAIELGRWRPLLLKACIGKPAEQSDAIDYRARIHAFEGKAPFLTQSLAPAFPEEPHVIMYTSGTTGRPKGAVLSHRKTFFNCLNADIFFKLHADDVMLVILPLFHSGGLFIQASPMLYKGATLVIHPKFDPLATCGDIARYRVTKFLGVPTVYRALLDVPAARRGNFSSLRVCAIGGEITTPELLRECHRAGFKPRQVMGQTETSILLWAAEEDFRHKPGSVGRPVFHAEVNLIDRQGNPTTAGEVGEIVVRGSIMMTEYWQDPVQTQRTIRHGRLYTGDLARVDEDGFYYLIDRAKDMYISGGENVYPAEVEKVLREHPGVRDIAIVKMADQTWGETGHAFVIPEPGTALAATDLTTFCEGRLARYKWPCKVTLCDQFPRTTLGKVRKVDLPRLYPGTP